MNKKLDTAHAFADMINAIEISADPDNFKMCLAADAVRQIRGWALVFIDYNKTQDLESINAYMKAFDNAVTEALPFIRTETAEDNQRDKKEKTWQGLALIINGLKLLAESQS